MASKYRFLWNRLSRLGNNFRALPVITTQKMSKSKLVTPCILSFSLFTWLGGKEKLSAEDELINTIKHCVLFIQKQEYEKAEQLLHVALRQAQQMQHELGITYIYDVMANLALQTERLDQAKNLFVTVSQRILAEGAKDDDPRIVHLSVKLARVCQLKGEYSTAQLGYEWSLDKLSKMMVEDPNDDTMKLFALTEDWYGRLYMECSRSEDGLKLMVSALNKMRELPDVEKEHIVVQLNDVGTICDQLGRVDEGINYFNEALEIAKSLNMEDLGTLYVNLGRAYMKKRLLDTARKYCGHGWKLGVTSKNKQIKKEAEMCLTEIKKAT